MKTKVTYFVLFLVACLVWGGSFANNGSQASGDASYTVFWENSNSTITATSNGASITLSISSPNYDNDLYIGAIKNPYNISSDLIEYSGMSVSGLTATHENHNSPIQPNNVWQQIDVLKVNARNYSNITFSFKGGVLYVCSGSSPCVSFGPDVPNIAGGASSVCLNNDDERSTITKPTVTAADEGWMLDGVKVIIADIDDYLLANMSSLDGKTLKYWAEDAGGTPGYSNEVTLSVCLPKVGDIASSGVRSGVGAYICLNSLAFTKPDVSGPYITEGWEIVDNNNVTQYVSITGEMGSQVLVDAEGVEQPLSSFYGKKIRYYAADAYGNKAYSNTVVLMSKPTVTIDLEGDEDTRRWDVCDGEPISEFPSVSYSMNGTTFSSANWYVWNTEKSGSNKWEKYTKQVITQGGPYTRIYYKVYPVSGVCGEASINDSKTDFSFKTTGINIKFSPALNASYGCSGHATATVTDLAGNVIDGTIYWTKNSVYKAKTDANSYNFMFDCETEIGEISLGAYILDPTSGCKSSVSQPVSIVSSYTTFLYVGESGALSNVTDASKWVKLNDDGTTDPSIHPTTNFNSEGCRYLINTSGVELLEGQSWTVSGEGSKIVVGDGTWGTIGRTSCSDLSIPNADSSAWTCKFTVSSANAGYGVPSGDFELMSSCTNTEWIANLSNIAKYDYRGYAKTFTISGTLNTEDNVVVDVKAGSSLTIATDNGDFKLGTLVQDKVALASPVLSYGITNGYSWASVIPGSSVTYIGSGCKKIRSGKYSQLYVESDKSTIVSFENAAIVDILQSFSTKNIGDVSEKVNPNSSLIRYIGSVNQNVKPWNYYNLFIGNASKKIVSSSTIIIVRNSLEVDASSTLEVKGEGKIQIYGDGNEAFINKGNVICSRLSTVYYLSSKETVIAPLYYGILSLNWGKRKFSSNSITGISNMLKVGTASCVTTGSNIEFDGTGAQSIPPLEYYNLTINNSGLDGSNNDQVSLAGDVVVKNQLSLVEGILNTNGHSLSVTNTATGAVGQGYRVSADSASYVIGYITRALPSNMPGTGSESYVFPVGTSDRYMPLSMSKIATGTDASVTVGTTPTSSASVVSPLTSVNTNAYWKIDGTNYTSSSVSVSSSNGLSSCNTLGFEKEGSSSFENIVGCSVSDNSICASSIVEGNGTVALANRNINAKTYYYNCSGNASSNSSWGTNTNGTGTHPVNFDEDDATYIFNCGATITNDLTISGSNTKVYFNTDYTSKLQIEANVTLPIVEHKRGLVEVAETGELNILNMYIMKDEVSNATDNNYETQQKMRKNRSILRNEGTVNIYNSNLTLTNSFVENSGNLNFYNTDISLSSTMDQGPDYNVINTDIPHTRFVNDGIIRMYNGSLLVERKSVHVRNGDGAVWLIDNTSSPSKTVKFNNVEFIDDGNDVQFVNFECGSSFMVKHSNVDFVYGGQTGKKNGMNGEVVVYDGNLYVKCNNGLGDFTIHECGSVYMIDTDDSGDGIFMVDGGSGWKMTVEGKLYAIGILNKSNGSGNKFNVANGAQIFVGDIGVTSSSSHSWDFSLDVQNGGTMNYCGNRTTGSDALGKNEGTLNYAGSFYQNSSPSTQGDVGGNGIEYIMYADGTECMADYEDTVRRNQGSIILPVELTMLYGICKDNVVELHWQTATESNNELFVVLRSFDGVNFEELGTVLGAGTTTDVQNYAFYDNDEKTGIVYYKLRQIDFDGKTKDSKIVAVQTCGKNAQFSIAEDEIVVTFKNPEEKNYVIVTSLTGKIVFSKSFENVPEARIASPRIKGIYIISVIDKSQITSEKFIR